MRYRAGPSHCTLIYKRPSHRTLPSSLCISTPQRFSSEEGRGSHKGLGGKVRGCPGRRSKTKQVLGSSATNLNLKENQFYSRITSTSSIKNLWILPTALKKRNGEGSRGERVGRGVFSYEPHHYLQVGSNNSSRPLFFFHSRSIWRGAECWGKHRQSHFLAY